MGSAYDNYERWFKLPIESLKPNRDAAFAVLMIAFPILERYLREKSGTGEGQLGPSFYNEFHRIFAVPQLNKVESLWHSYRNGLLHQATLSLKMRKGTVMPSSFVTSQVALIEYDAGQDVFYINPNAFADRVMMEIEANFAVFEGLGSFNHPLPQVIAHQSTFISPGDDPPTGTI